MDKQTINLQTPVSDETLKSLHAGDIVSITGTVYTARDAAHKRLFDMLKKGEPMPFELTGQAVYYAGPCPNRPEHAIGSVGPTTSGRMDSYSPALIKAGLKLMIGKGFRSDDVKRAIVAHGGVYLAAIGGAGALMSKCVKAVEVVAFEDLDTEAVRKLTVENFPAVVAIDSGGNDIYGEMT